ncbi:MAG: alpha/beta hydrolase [Alphaproteobacteria bacterium]|nr:MAG: alpha/beta hydrolase [Alphaproteobacteria bacterium]
MFRWNTNHLWPTCKLFLNIAVLVLFTACTLYVPYQEMPDLTGKLTERYFIAPGGATLPLRRFEVARPKAMVIAVHGFNDYGMAFASTAKFLNSKQISVIAYDQRGFGEAPNQGNWPGAATLVQDLRALTNAVKEQYPKTPLYILGDSMGGGVSLLASTEENSLPADGVILVAPAVWGRTAMNPLQVMALWFSAHTMPWLSLSGKHLDLKPSDNMEMLRALAADRLVQKEARTDKLFGMTDLMDAALAAAPKIKMPTLILYGAHDDIIPKSALRAMTRALPENDKWQFIWYDNGYHMLLRDLQAENVHQDIWAFIEGKTAIKNPRGRVYTESNRKEIPL